MNWLWSRNLFVTISAVPWYTLFYTYSRLWSNQRMNQVKKIKDGQWDLCENEIHSIVCSISAFYMLYWSVFVKLKLIIWSQSAFIDLTKAAFTGSNIVDGGGCFSKSERGSRIRRVAPRCCHTHYVMHCRLESQTRHCRCLLPAGVYKLQVRTLLCVSQQLLGILHKRRNKKELMVSCCSSWLLEDSLVPTYRFRIYLDIDI